MSPTWHVRSALALCRVAVAFLAWPAVAAAQKPLETDRIDITGRQSLTLGSGARAMGMGGAFLAWHGVGLLVATFPSGLNYETPPGFSERLHAALRATGSDTWATPLSIALRPQSAGL